jgi:hypothetical protein
MLLLFDIDGTLLIEGVTPVAEAITIALKEVHRVDMSYIRTHILVARDAVALRRALEELGAGG